MATKRKKVGFVGVPEDEAGDREEPAGKRVRTFKDKHSLDSDEEDKADDTGELGDDDLAYHEKSTISWDEGQKITPFNLDEEMEEGRFDAHGNYYVKDGEEVADTWLDSVNWEKIRAEEDSDDEAAVSGAGGDAGEQDEKEEDEDGDDEDDDDDESTEDDVYSLVKEVCDLLKPGETVAGALRRLGTTPARPKFRKGKQQEAASDGLSAEERAAKRAALSALTSVADRLVQLGRMSVYEETYEKFMFEIREHEDKAVEMAVGDSEIVAHASATGSTSSLPTEVQNAGKAPSDCSEVCWNVKSATGGTSTVAVDVFGPFSSTQMNDWAEKGTFGSQGVMVRKAKDITGDFYSSNRIDFDLYTD